MSVGLALVLIFVVLPIVGFLFRLAIIILIMACQGIASLFRPKAEDRGPSRTSATRGLDHSLYCECYRCAS
jgi:hypothetical protein